MNVILLVYQLGTKLVNRIISHFLLISNNNKQTKQERKQKV